MKCKKIFATLIASFALISVCPVINLQKVEAKTTSYKFKTYMKYAKKAHRVLITEPTQVYRVHPGYDEAHNRYTKAYVLKPGDFATIWARGVAWGWTIGNTGKYCSMRSCYNFNWFDTYQKHIYIDAGLFNGAKKRTNKTYTLSWKQYCKLVKMGLWSLPVDSNGYNKIDQQIRNWNLKAK